MTMIANPGVCVLDLCRNEGLHELSERNATPAVNAGDMCHLDIVVISDCWEWEVVLRQGLLKIST